MRRGGIHLALEERDLVRLEEGRRRGGGGAGLLQAAVDRFYDEDRCWLAESDDAWKVIHWALVDGDPQGDGGDYPWSHVVLGGRSWDDAEAILRLKSPQTAADVAEALRDLHGGDFLARFPTLAAAGLGRPVPEADRLYAWKWLRGVADLFQRAARERRWVLFGVERRAADEPFERPCETE